MSIEKTRDILRMLKLAGREDEIIPENYSASEEIEYITETEWADLPKNMKAVIEGKKHVLGYLDNQFKLKPIKDKEIADDKGKAPDTNKVSDYEKDGGDAKATNKKMGDNDKTGDKVNEENLNEHGASNQQRGVARGILNKRKSKLSLDKQKSAEEHDDEHRLKDMEDKKARAQKAEEILKKSKLVKSRLEGTETQMDSNGEPLDAVTSQGLNPPNVDDPEPPLGEQFENPQEFDKDDAEEYYGLKGPREFKVSVSKKLTQAINNRIKEIKASIDSYDEKGYNDGDGANSNKIKAIDALEQIKDNLSSRDYEGFREAQLFFLTLMSPITDLFPSEVVGYMAVGKNKDAETGFNDEVKPFETSLKESYMFSREARFNKYFIQEVLPNVVRQYGYDDKPAIDQAYNDTLDNFERDGSLPPSSRNWTLPDGVTANPEKYVSESVKMVVEYGTDSFNEDNTAVETWFERDRQYVGLYPKDDEGKPDTNKKAIVEWWDEAVTEAVEDGFLDPRDWHGSALDYARHTGVIKEHKSSYSLKHILESKKKKSKVNPCWPGYKQVGWKPGIKGKKKVPNCVPEDEADDDK